MTKIANSLLCCLILLAVSPCLLPGQSVPVMTGSPLYEGFQVPTVGGTLRYSLNLGQRFTLGYNGTNSTASYTNMSGNLAFITPSVLYPLTVNYSGGYLASTLGQPSAFFQTLDLTQVYNRRKWQFTVSDSVRYLPETPSSGYSGLGGLGNLGATIGAGGTQGILTPFATRVENNAAASASYKLTGSSSLDANGFYGLQRFLETSGGIQTNSYGGTGGLFHRINALSSITASYRYFGFSYININGNFVSQGGILSYRRQLTRRILVNVGGGPDRISAQTLTGKTPSLTYAIDANLTYAGSVQHASGATINYIRSSDGGSGITYGTETDTFRASTTRRFGRSLQVTGQFSYGKSSGQQITNNSPLDVTSYVGAVQVNRAITRTVSAFAEYSGQHQSFTGSYSGALAPLNGLTQEVGFGVTYSPSPLHLGRQ